MWADLGYELPIKEGIYWLDNNFIKAFTPDGTLHKLWKYKVFDDLHIEITKYKGNKMVLLTYLNSGICSLRYFLIIHCEIVGLLLLITKSSQSIFLIVSTTFSLKLSLLHLIYNS